MGDTKVSIKNLQQYGSRGWQWKVAVTEPWDDEPVEAEYRTNVAGDGLWRCGTYQGECSDNYQDKQIQGTCQFSLPAKERAARSKLYRQFRAE